MQRLLGTVSSIFSLNLLPFIHVCHSTACCIIIFGDHNFDCPKSNTFNCIFSFNFRELWLSTLECEAAYRAVHGDSTIIHNVGVTWLPDHNDVSMYNAMFQLPILFCTERMIRFLSMETNWSQNPGTQASEQ